MAGPPRCLEITFTYFSVSVFSARVRRLIGDTFQIELEFRNVGFVEYVTCLAVSRETSVLEGAAVTTCNSI